MKSILLSAILLVISLPVWAEDKQVAPAAPALAINPATPLTQKASSAQDIAFLFYKLSGKNPDFAKMVAQTNSFQSATPEAQQTTLTKDVPMMEMGFRNFAPALHPIIIRTTVQTKVNIGNKNGIEITFGGDPKSPVYFPYIWGGDHFAVLADGIEQFKFLPMKLETASRIGGKIDANGTSTLILELKPIKADGRNPFPLDGIPQWLFMTKIVKAYLVNQYLEVLWEYETPS
jgi:hypothetical protein